MSRVRQIIELDSPTLKCKRQQLTGLVQKCNYCSGNGWIWGIDEFGEGVKVKCPMCQGTGMMRPTITINWESVCKK